MSKLSVYRASAGSGKTFRLILRYLEKVFENPNAYLGILAVTFTNKAADEMKSRLLSELHSLDQQPSASPYTPFLRQRFDQPDEWISRQASLIKSKMLHDFSHVSVETIDSFFQKILRSFARETGLSPAYQLEMDSGKLLEEFSATVFRELDSDPGTREWLTEWVIDRMEEGRPWYRLESEIIATGMELLKEQVLRDIVNSDSNSLIETDISAIKHTTRRIMREFRQNAETMGNQARQVLDQSGLDIACFWSANTGPAGYLRRLNGDSKPPGPNVLNSLGEINRWLPVSKNKNLDPGLRQALFESLNSLAKQAVDLFENHYRDFTTASAINRNLPSLWFASRMIGFIREYAQEKNLILINLVQPLINAIVTKNDSPFIYERTGNWFHHFLIDEFQDTSDLQWENFKPLINNSLSEGGMSLLVGDVKQSLYRWRNSNWKLLHQRAEQDMRAFGSEPEALLENHRSCRSILDFNNEFFSQVPLTYLSDVDVNQLTEVYAETRQQGGARSAMTGRVEIRFYQKGDEDQEDPAGRISQDLPEIIDDLLRHKGYRQDDILLLVRKNEEGTRISDLLNQYQKEHPDPSRKPWSLVSADVFRIGSAPVIRLILLAYRYMTDPSNLFLKKSLSWEYARLHPDALFPGQNPTELIPAEMDENIQSLKVLSPIQACDELLRLFKLDEEDAHTPYLFQFRDQLRLFCSREPGTIPGFLHWWDATGCKQNLVTEGQPSAMRIMTIHKAKGLSSPVVIIPYCSWKLDHDPFLAPWIWVETQNTPFSQVPRIPVKYSSKLESTYFADPYREEKFEVALDNLNLLYVAFTRPKDILIVCCPTEGKGKTVANLLEHHLGTRIQEGKYTLGDPDFRNPDQVTALPLKPLIPARLSASALPDVIVPKVDLTGDEARFGRLVHGLLEKTSRREDLPVLLDRMLRSGEIKPSELQTLQEKIDPVFNLPEMEDWCGNDWTVLTESTILVPGSGAYRPDRVMLRNRHAVVVDYKSGAVDTKHKHQVSRYMSLLNQMGYDPVQGYLLYLDKPEIEEVTKTGDVAWSRPDQTSPNGFLARVARDLWDSTGGEMQEVLAVVPNRRSGQLLRQELLACADQIAWCPEIISIDEWMIRLSGLIPVDPVTVLVSLYQEAKKQMPGLGPFDLFMDLGEMILADFDDIDQYLVNPERVFMAVRELKRIDTLYGSRSDPELLERISRFWQSIGQNQSDQQEQWIGIWEKLYPVYRGLQQHLLEQNLATRGMCYRKALAQATQQKAGLENYTTVAFIGFNMLTGAEEKLFSYLKDIGKARFYWDFHESYLVRRHEAGRFINNYREAFPVPPGFRPFPDSAVRDEPHIQVLAATSNTGQIQSLVSCLKQDHGASVGIVLPDETLLPDLILAWPEEAGPVNFTSGYPLFLTQAASFFRALIDLVNTIRLEPVNQLVDPDLLQTVLEHPWFDRIPDPEWLNRILSVDSITEILTSITQIISRLTIGALPVEQAAADALTELTGELTGRLERNHFNPGFKAVRSMLIKSLNGSRITLESERNARCQVAGILEMRLLDFTHVYALSFNEGVWPSQALKGSLIPYSLRRYFGLPTAENRDALYSYYFYRLISRATGVTLFYLAGHLDDAFRSGEMSRYVSQLNFERSSGLEVLSEPMVGVMPVDSPGDLHKTGVVLELLNRFFDPDTGQRLSASALNDYLTCSYRFACKYLFGMREPREETLASDPLGFGTLVHKVLEMIYQPFMGQATGPSTAWFRQTLQDEDALDQVLLAAFRSLTEGASDRMPAGKDKLAIQVAREFVRVALKTDQEVPPRQILHLEETFYHIWQVPTPLGSRCVRLKAVIDRIDRMEKGIRIIDYKSGNADLEFKEVGELFKRQSDSRKKEIFQVLLYAEMVTHSQQTPADILPALYRFTHLRAGNPETRIARSGQGLIYSDVMEAFRSELTDLLAEILNPEVSFSKVTNRHTCRYCPYSGLCRRD